MPAARDKAKTMMAIRTLPIVMERGDMDLKSCEDSDEIQALVMLALPTNQASSLLVLASVVAHRFKPGGCPICTSPSC